MIATRIIFVGWTAFVTACAIEYRVPHPDAQATDDEAGPETNSGADTGSTTESVSMTGDAASDSDDGCILPLVSCGAACVDPMTNPDHCGDCDVVCDDTQACDQGECVSECAGGLMPCDRMCTDLDSDVEHCGRCTEVCEPDGTCQAGDCIDACGDTCDNDLELCVSGACECRPEFVLCGENCVDTRIDAQHCGDCDDPCDDAPCGDSECQAGGCPAPWTTCGDSCVDLDVDLLHCGKCDDPCKADEICVNGDCEDSS